jgi:transcriptional regulator with XRE-family HTH domain
MKSDEELLKEIGLRLKKLREESGCSSYEKFAFENDISRMHYWQIEKGKVNITIKTLNKLLSVHKIELEDFLRIEVK